MDMIIIGILTVCIFMAHEIVEFMYDTEIIVEEDIKDDTDK